MTIVTNIPTALFHTTNGQNETIPQENEVNANWRRYWTEVEDAISGRVYSIDRVESRETPPTDIYSINIGPRFLTEALSNMAGVFGTTNEKLEMVYSIRIAILKQAESDSIANLSPLSSATEDTDYQSWVDNTFAN